MLRCVSVRSVACIPFVHRLSRGAHFACKIVSRRSSGGDQTAEPEVGGGVGDAGGGVWGGGVGGERWIVGVEVGGGGERGGGPRLPPTRGYGGPKGFHNTIKACRNMLFFESTEHQKF